MALIVHGEVVTMRQTLLEKRGLVPAKETQEQKAEVKTEEKPKPKRAPRAKKAE